MVSPTQLWWRYHSLPQNIDRVCVVLSVLQAQCGNVVAFLKKKKCLKSILPVRERCRVFLVDSNSALYSAPTTIVVYVKSYYIGPHYNGIILYMFPNSKVHGANMGPIWGQQDPGGPHASPMNLVIWGITLFPWVMNIIHNKENICNKNTAYI